MKGSFAMALFQRSKDGFGPYGRSTRQAMSREQQEVDGRLRDFCKAKAEVIVSGETTQALRDFLNPFKGK